VSTFGSIYNVIQSIFCRFTCWISAVSVYRITLFDKFC